MIKMLRLKSTKAFFLFSFLLINFIPSASSEENYADVYSFLEACTLAGIKIRGTPVLQSECRPIFKDKFTGKVASNLEEFNRDWLNAGGEYELTRPLNITKGSSFLTNQYRFSRREANLRDELYESLSPNWYGKINITEASSTIYEFFDVLAPVLYSQFTNCFSKMHNNTRLVRELISKINFLETGNPKLSDRQIFIMDNAGIFSVEKKTCEAFEKAFDKASGKLIENFKANAIESNATKRECKPLVNILSSTKRFRMSDYSPICAKHYKENLDRILPVALRVMNDIQEEEKQKNETSSEQLIN